MSDCPDPQSDWEGYCLWTELHACPQCDGTGMIDMDDDLQMECTYCDGGGVDPAAIAETEEE